MPYFRCYQDGVHRTFVIEVTDQALIKRARSIVNGFELEAVSVRGRVVKEPRRYNRPWSWHLDPSSIDFFRHAPEVCDASVVHLEEHLDEVGGAYLPKSIWCPWKSRVIEEIEFD